MSNSKINTGMVRNIDVGIIQFGESYLKSADGFGTSSTRTPLSPSSDFTTSIIKDVPDSIFRAVLLVHWDNILGPRIHHVWTIDGSPNLSSSDLRCITGQVLSSEICRDVDSNFVDFKFFNLTHKEIIVPAFVFCAKGSYGLGIHSLAVVLSQSELQLYLEIHELLQRCFQRLAYKIRVILDTKVQNPSDSMDKIGLYLSDSIRFISALKKQSLAENVLLSSTAFCPDHVLEFDFLSQCIASHLMTFGRSFITGETADRINLVIHTLSLFNTVSERRCSLPINPQHPWPYHHDIYLQGFIKHVKDPIENCLPMTEILCSKYPTTVIDVSTRVVKQTLSYNEHIIHSFETLQSELISIQNGQFENVVVFDRELYPSSAYPDTLVQNFLSEMFQLPESCEVRMAFITQFHRLLYKKAECLIEQIKVESDSARNPMKASQMKKIRQDLLLNAEGDFRIIVALAEKLKPGIYCFLLGDRRVDRTVQTNVEIL
ncbi:hypothetical protein CHS0354_026279 [Potamilus streckersoni]|uniref:Uncharacterized protein n=1 Tax=Potamilus streckersoni TaxID=2493646 RepID=A0AAE0T226_9BIVA|nr:hypothetical protein CHS0354_026279 [Potamilus streckersoni]